MSTSVQPVPQGQGSAPPDTSDADLWDHYVSQKMDPHEATARVLNRRGMPADSIWDQLTAQGANPDSATSIVSRVTGAKAAEPPGGSALNAGLVHAGIAATYGAARKIVPAITSAVESIPGIGMGIVKGGNRLAETLGLSNEAADRAFEAKGPQSAADIAAQSEAGLRAEEAPTAHPIASATGSFLGAAASPLNRVVGAAAAPIGKVAARYLPGTANFLGNTAAGAIGSGLIGAGQARSPTGGMPSWEDMKAAAGPAAVAGGVFGGTAGVLTGALGKAVKRGAINQEIGEQLAANPAQSQAAYGRGVDDGEPITDADVLDRVNHFKQLPEWQRAYREGQVIARNRGQIVPDIPGMETSGSPARLVQDPDLSIDPAVVGRIHQDNPSWSPSRVQQAALDPDLARMYGGLQTGPATSVTPRQLETWRQGVSKIGDPAQIQTMNKFLKESVDPVAQDYAAARAIRARGHSLEELQNRPSLPGAQLARAGLTLATNPNLVSKTGAVIRAVQALQSGEPLSPQAEELLKEINQTASGTSKGYLADLIWHMGPSLPGAALSAAQGLTGGAPTP